MTTAANFTAAQAAEEDVTTSLYRAAIGPVSTPYYLPIFTRFEEAEHAGISWNTAASLTTLNWLVFRKLWGAALAYVGIVVAIVLLVFGIGSLEVQYSETLMVALGLGFILAAFVLPGLYGNAVLHRESRRRMAAAAEAHADVQDARTQLTRQASTRQRAVAIAVANVAFWLLVLLAYLQFTAVDNLAVMPQSALEPGNVVVGRAVDATASASLPIADAPTLAPTSALETTASAVEPTPVKATTVTEAATADKVEKPYFVNVGLFAKPENAAGAHTKLLAAQLPSVTKKLKTSKGLLTRVRVGPFNSQSQAQTAVEKIKALQLDAIIVQP